MSRARSIAAVCLAGALIALPAAGAGAATKLLKASSGPLTVTLSPPATHTPKINANVWITVAATLHGKPASNATAYYQFLYSGTVVSTQYVRNNKNFTFTGHFRDNLIFPASAVGQPLTLRINVKAGGRTVHFDWPITAHK
jgi:hypothetical protein